MVDLHQGNGVRGNNSSVGGVLDSLPCVMQRHRLDLPLSLQWKGFFPEVNMGSDSIPRTLSAESIHQGLVCAHLHSIARTHKILTFMS